MNNLGEERENFIKEFSVINKNKFTLQQTKSLYFGLIYQLIMNKTIFTQNIDLASFIKVVFAKEYCVSVYKGRPYLASRLLNDISKEYDSLEVSTSIKAVIHYLETEKKTEVKSQSDSKIKGDTKRSSSRNMEDEVVGWFNTVTKGSKNS